MAGNLSNFSFVYYFNSSENTQPVFFDTYYSLARFVVETSLAVTSVVVNLIALIAAECSKTEATLSHPLFVNLALSNTLASALAWLFNNVLVLFEELVIKLMYSEKLCRVTLMGLGASILMSMLGIISTLTLLGFAIIQCIAINKPLHYTGLVTRKKINLYLLAIWSVTIAASVLPMTGLVISSENRECTKQFLKDLVFGITVCGNLGNAIIGAVYVAIIVLCIKVYIDIRKHWDRIHHFRQRWELHRNWKAFVTTALLVGSLTMFFLPSCVVYFVTMNFNDMSLSRDSSILTYIMNMLPYVKFITDPVIYGMRTKEVREGYRRVTLKCSDLQRQTPPTSRLQLQYTSSFVTSTVPTSPGAALKPADIAMERFG